MTRANLRAVPRRGPEGGSGHVRHADEDADRRALVRAIASAPVHMQWLREHVGKILVREAGMLERLGDAEGADHLRRRAAAHVAGDTPLW